MAPDGLLRREDGLKLSGADANGEFLDPDGLLRREDGLKPETTTANPQRHAVLTGYSDVKTD